MGINIDAAIFLPGYVANGSEDINVPLLAIDQVDQLINLYNGNNWQPLFPYIGETISLIRSEYICNKTPLVNKWVPIMKICQHKQIDQILCLLLIKYGWDIPQTVINRCKQYADILSSNTLYSNNTSFYKGGHFSHRNNRDSNDFELSRILYQIDHKNCAEHLLYVTEYCLNVLNTTPNLHNNNVIDLLSHRYDVPSHIKLYGECVKSLVNMCILASYINITINIPDEILYSLPFQTCLLNQPRELLNYYSGSISIADRFARGVDKPIPEYKDKDVLFSIMNKFGVDNTSVSGISLIGIPETCISNAIYDYNKTILGVNPSVSDYLNLHRGKDLMAQAWYCGALALGSDSNNVINRNLILKSLACMWRMNVGNYISMPLGYIAEVAKRINANMDDILGSSYSMKMSNLSWALKDMPALHEIGMSIGPLTTNMISIFVIKHAKQAQAVTGLQQMVEKINGGQ